MEEEKKHSPPPEERPFSVQRKSASFLIGHPVKRFGHDGMSSESYCGAVKIGEEWYTFPACAKDVVELKSLGVDPKNVTIVQIAPTSLGLLYARFRAHKPPVVIRFVTEIIVSRFLIGHLTTHYDMSENMFKRPQDTFKIRGKYYTIPVTVETMDEVRALDPEPDKHVVIEIEPTLNADLQAEMRLRRLPKVKGFVELDASAKERAASVA